MSWLTLPRLPEPEAMDDASEVEAYASAAAQSHLEAIDDTWVEQVAALGLARGRMLDVGAGPGQIPLKIARRLPALRVVGVDRSWEMVRTARRNASAQELAGRAGFVVADGGRLPFAAASFDLVLSNSVLHHLPDPAPAFEEMARVAKPSGWIMLRDLRRPSRPAFRPHVAWFGRHYKGLMKKLYTDSVRAAYTGRELARLLERSSLAGARIFYHRRTHLGFIRPGVTNPPHKLSKP